MLYLRQINKAEWGVGMRKSRKGFENPERRLYKQKSPKRFEMDIEQAWENGHFDSRLGTNFQSINAPYKKHLTWEWYEGVAFKTDYRKSGGDRKQFNAKAKKPKNKKYYRKARSQKTDLIQKHRCAVPDTIFQCEKLKEQWQWVHYRGGYYATCKGCELPMPLRGMHNSDMAVCYECADDLWWIEDWFLEYDLDREDEERVKLAS